MDTRMNKYYDDEGRIVSTRTRKNEELYREIGKNELDNYEVKSNSTVIGETKAEIDVEKIKKILDTKYNEVPKRKSIRLEDTEEVEEEKEITKEYDINVVLEKAKENKKENYEEERLKKLKNTQYDILNSIKIKKDEEEEKSSKNPEIEDLINTIAFNEKNSKENSDLDLLSELKGDDNTEVLQGLKEEVNEELTKDKTDQVLEDEETDEKDELETKEENEDKNEEISEDTDDLEKTKLMDSFYTSSNSLVKKDFEDDSDFVKEINNGNTLIKTIIIIVAIIFAIGLALLIKALFFS